MSDDNIIPFEPRKPAPPLKHPPMFNIPPATKILTGLLIGIHVVLYILSMTFVPAMPEITAYFGGFIPASWTGAVAFDWWTPLTIISFSFLHAGWMHLGFNTVMLVAMGSGLEKTVGIKNYLIVYVGSTLFAAFAHLALYPSSIMPIIGASGGISGIFGAMLVMMNRPSANGRSNLMPVMIAYIGITALMGLMGAPDGSSVAWIAHIGGFLAGAGFMMTILKNQK